MIKSQREMVLGVLFAAAIAIAGLWESIGGIILQPLSDAQASVESARANLIAMKDQEKVIDQAIRNLKELDLVGLPADRGEASSVYQGWLISQLEACSIDSPIVTPGPAIIENAIGNRIPFVVQFEAASAQLARFLDRFHATPLLHRVTNLHIIRSSDGEQDHRVMLSIEALSMESGSDTKRIPDPISLDDDSTLAALILHNDVFCSSHPETSSDEIPLKEEAAPKREIASTQVSRQPVTQDPKNSVRFIGSVWNGRHREAWLIDSRSMQEVTVFESAEFSFPGVAGRIISVDDDSLQFDLNRQHFRLELGQTLAEASLKP